MSTTCKLDRNVRLDRYLRKQALRELEGDVRTATKKMAQGQWLLRTMPVRSWDGVKMPTPEEQAHIDAINHQLTDIARFSVISKLTLDHLTKVKRDPRRTGAAKEAIFVKLGAEART